MQAHCWSGVAVAIGAVRPTGMPANCGKIGAVARGAKNIAYGVTCSHIICKKHMHVSLTA